jgi:isopentenyl phosphate kinase
MKPLQFLKLGGSLITEKDQPHTPRLEVINRLAVEIARARQDDLSLRLVLGHGSGSFGHVPAIKYGTRQGVRTEEQWQGFLQVWSEAAALHHLVVRALAAAGLPAISFPPSSSVTAVGGLVSSWDLQPLQAALQAGLLPVVYGDVVFDSQRGGTILSTEDLFTYLAGTLHPQRILLAGLEPGVWADYPACNRLLAEITPGTIQRTSAALRGSAAVDVTGGMASKVELSLQLVGNSPSLQVWIFSGEPAGSLQRALQGEPLGTLIHNGTPLNF